MGYGIFIYILINLNELCELSDVICYMENIEFFELFLYIGLLEN